MNARICLLTTSFPRSSSDDAGIFMQRLVEALSEQGAQGLVIVPRDAEEPCQDQCARFALRRYRYWIWGSKLKLAFGAGIMPNLRSNPLLLMQAPGLLLGMIYWAIKERKKWDILHANWSAAWIAAWLVGLISQKQFFVTLRGEDMRMLKVPLLGRLLVYILKRAAFIISVNEEFVEQIRSKIGSRAIIKCIPNGVTASSPTSEQLEIFRHRYQLDAARNYLLCVGTVIPRKRIELLLELLACAELREFSLLVCGRIDDQRYVDSLRELNTTRGLESRVRFVGKIPPADVSLFLATALCLVSASAAEGRPNVVLEALAAGTPVCVSRISAHEEIVDGTNGFLFSEQKIGEAAKWIAHLASASSLRQELATRGKESVSRLTWTRCASEYLNLVNGVLGE